MNDYVTHSLTASPLVTVSHAVPRPISSPRDKAPRAATGKDGPGQVPVIASAGCGNADDMPTLRVVLLSRWQWRRHKGA